MAINPKLINFNRVPTAAVGPAYQAGLTDINEFSRDQDMVDALLKRGSSTEPVQSTREGAYRALQGVLGGYMKGRDKRELQSQKDNFRKTMAQALIAGRGTPGTEETIPQSVVTPTDTRLGVTDPDMLQTELPPQQSILDDPSVPDVASLGLERIETPTGPGGQVIQKEYISRTPGTPGGIQPMLDVLRGAGTREADQAAIELQFGGMQQQAALEAQAAARALTVSDQDKVRAQEVVDRDLGYENATALEEAKRGDGAFRGTSMDAQVMNILLSATADTSSREYAAAYAYMAQPKTNFDQATNRLTTINPDMSAFRTPAPASSQPEQTQEGGEEETSSVPRVQIEQVAPRPARFTEGQGKSAGFANRMHDAEKTLSSFQAEGLSAAGRFKEALPLGNYLQTPEYQQYAQARRNFINAQLRRESGAAIAPSEFTSAEKQYFPSPGDGPEVIKQKEKNRRIAIDSMMTDAGPSYERPGVPVITTQEQHDALSIGDEFREEEGGEIRTRVPMPGEG